jgi:hypothetical protein
MASAHDVATPRNRRPERLYAITNSGSAREVQSGSNGTSSGAPALRSDYRRESTNPCEVLGSVRRILRASLRASMLL